jgi:PAS domain S-box-containing protein
VLGIWAIANVAWTYASYTANEFPINSIWWSFYRLAGVPIAMTFFLKDRMRQPRLDPELILDWAQVTILVSATYFVLHYLPIQQMSLQAALVRNEIGTNMENLLLLGGALVIFLCRRSSELTPLFARLVLLLLGYSIVAATGNYLDAHLAAPDSAWKDLLWSISYFLLPAIASTWEPSNQEEEAAAITGREGSFAVLLASNLALMTLLISIRALAEHMQGGWRVLGICTIAISLLIYAARLAVTQYSQQQEVKQRKNAEEAVRETHRQTELLLNSVPSILIGLDPGGRIRRCNRAATTILGWDESTLVGKTLGNSGVKWLIPDVESKVAAALADPKINTLDDLSFDRDGNTRFLGLRVIPLVEADGGSLIVGADITERLFLEAQLRQSHKLEAIGQLAAGIAHEINTPTQFVANNTTFLKESWNTIDRLLQLAETMEKERAETGSIAESSWVAFRELSQQSDLEYIRTEVPTAIDQSLEGLQRVTNIVRAMKEFFHPGSKDKHQLTSTTRSRPRLRETNGNMSPM